MKDRVTGVTIKQITDSETGEILDEQRILITKPPAEPPFIKMYLKHIGRVLHLPGISSDILTSLLKEINAENQIILNSFNKDKICKELNIERKTLSNNLSKLVKNQEYLKGSPVLYKIGRGAFEPNPILFSRQNWPKNWERIKELKITSVFNEAGQAFENSTIEEVEENKEPEFNFGELETINESELPEKIH